MTKDPYHVYLVECADGTLYTGIALDVALRVRAHNDGKAGARYTRARRPVILRYSEQHPDKGSALRREHALKQLPRAAKVALIASAVPSYTGGI